MEADPRAPEALPEPEGKYQEYREHLRRRTPHQVEEDRMLIESSNDIALRDSEW